jgi:hypothetical protein
MALAIEGTFTNEIGTAADLTVTSVNASAGSTVVVLASSNGPGTTQTLTISGGGLTYTKVEMNTQPTSAAIAVAQAPAGLSAATITIDRANQITGLGSSAVVVVLTGAEPTWSSALSATGNSASGTPAVAITTGKDGSYLFSTFADFLQRGLPGPGVDPPETELNDHDIAGEYSAGQNRTTNTVPIGTYTMDFTGSATRQYNMVVVEIRDAAAAGPAAAPAGPYSPAVAASASIADSLFEQLTGRP